MENNFDEREVIELTSEEEISLTEEFGVNDEKENESKKKKRKFSWKKLSKKGKIIVISVISFLVLLIIGIILFIFVFNKEEEKEVHKEPDVILESSNYRYENGVLIFFDKNDKEIGKYTCTNKETDLCYSGIYNQETILDVDTYTNESNELITFDIPMFNDNFVFIADHEKDEINLILYDLSKNEIIGNYKSAKRFQTNNIILENEEGKFGVITFGLNTASTLIEFTYDYLGSNDEYKNLMYMQGDKYGILNTDNTVIASGFANPIIAYNDSYVVSGTDRYSLYTLKKEELLSANSYSFIKLIDENIYLIEDNKMFVRDNKLNKLNEEEIDLNTSDYKDYIIFNDNLSKVGTKEAFTSMVESNILTITVDKEEIKLNLGEALLNSNYSYVNYLDGILYFYADEAKEELISSYKCTNKNIIENESSSYSNCFIGVESKTLNRVNSKDALGLIPIYNQKYVFISDNKTGATTNTIKLYDLTTEKEIASYLSIDVGYYNDTNNVVVATADNLIVMAKNQSNKYGLMTIGEDGLSGMVPFDFETIELIEDGIVGKEATGDYHLFDTFGDRITEKDVSITSEILDFEGNYLKVKNTDGKYLVYKNTGSIVSNSLDNIILGTTKFLGETSDKLEIYSYTDGKSNILIEPIDLESSNYEFTDNEENGFEIRFYDNDKKLLQTYSYNSDGTLKS